MSDKDDPEFTDEDDMLWEHVTGSVEALPGKKPKKMANVEAKKPPGSLSEEYVPQEEKSSTAPKKREFSFLQVGDVAGVDKSTADKLRKGKMSIEAKLDLHGHTQQEAVEALEAFLDRCFEQRKRCVMVVTGKGRKADGSQGVLFENVPKWLNLPDIRPMLLAFTYAQNKDGGDGALYILLRKNR